MAEADSSYITLAASETNAASTSLFELVPVKPQEIGADRVQTVDARRLHAALGSGKDFSTWIKGKLDRYGFEEGRDYVREVGLSSPNSGSSKARAQQTVEYTLTLDTAKEIAMVENTDRGREVRRYFLECERLANTALATAGIDMRAIGGVVKSVVIKQIDEAIRKRLPEMIAVAMATDPRIAVGEYISVKELLDEAKALPKGRNSINRKIGNALRALVATTDASARRCPRTKTWLFPVELAHRYMRSAGGILVSEHNAFVRGQGVLKLVQPKKQKPENEGAPL